MNSVYKQDGVDVPLGDKFSQYAWGVCQSTFDNSPFVKIGDMTKGHFRGPRGFSLQGLSEGCMLTQTVDGVGTKSIVTSAAMTHRSSAKDLLAMCCGDITRYGGLPLVFTNILDVRTLNSPDDETAFEAFTELMAGLGEAATEQKLVIFGGETAELGVCVGSDDPNATTMFNWGGMAIGVYHPDKMILGDSLAVGQAIMGHREYGFRSNGLSSARKAMALKYGDEWYNNPEAEEDIRRVAEPSTSYDLFLSQMNGWWSDYSIERPIKTHLIVHVTGGAIKSKLGKDKLFLLGLSAILDDLWEPPEIMKKCAEWRGMSDEDCYETWGCGTGVFVVIDKCDAESYISQAARFGIEAKRCGYVTETRGAQPFVSLRSKFSSREIVLL